MEKRFFSLLRRKSKKTSSYKYRDDILIRQGAEQFKRLIDRGIDLPVVHL